MQGPSAMFSIHSSHNYSEDFAHVFTWGIYPDILNLLAHIAYDILYLAHSARHKARIMQTEGLKKYFWFPVYPLLLSIEKRPMELEANSLLDWNMCLCVCLNLLNTAHLPSLLFFTQLDWSKQLVDYSHTKIQEEGRLKKATLWGNKSLLSYC